MIISTRDLILPSLYISVIIGYQIFIYLVYQYKKTIDKNIKYNKILLGYGFLYGLSLTGVLFRIFSLYYLTGTGLFSLYVKISMLLLNVSLMPYLLMISFDEFNAVIPTKNSKFFLFYCFIPLISLLFLDVDSLVLLTIFILTIPIICLYIIYFHIKLMILSTGQIRKRLFIILIGAEIEIVSMLVGGYMVGNVLLPAQNDLLVIFSIPFFITGLTIIFFGVFRFPAFLEFKWKDNLLSLLIINREGFNLLYYSDFGKDLEGMRKDNLKQFLFTLSRGVFGIEDIASSISIASKKNLSKINHENLLILLEHADKPFSNIIFALLVKEEMMSLRYILTVIKNQFQNYYKPLLLNLDAFKGKEQQMFSTFTEKLMSIIK